MPLVWWANRERVCLLRSVDLGWTAAAHWAYRNLQTPLGTNALQTSCPVARSLWRRNPERWTVFSCLSIAGLADGSRLEPLKSLGGCSAANFRSGGNRWL